MDLIDREQLMNYIRSRKINIGKLAHDVIMKQPSIQPQESKWIPVSERLPEAFEHCLWTTTEGDVIYHHWDGLISKYKAWMPLPQPYKTESEVER